jgi:hypothetical protein
MKRGNKKGVKWERTRKRGQNRGNLLNRVKKSALATGWNEMPKSA